MGCASERVQAVYTVQYCSRRARGGEGAACFLGGRVVVRSSVAQVCASGALGAALERRTCAISRVIPAGRPALSSVEQQLV